MCAYTPQMQPACTPVCVHIPNMLYDPHVHYSILQRIIEHKHADGLQPPASPVPSHNQFNGYICAGKSSVIKLYIAQILAWV